MTFVPSTFPSIPRVPVNSGFASDLGSILPPPGRIAAYVRSTGFQDLDYRDVRSRLVLSIKDALGLCRPGQPDTIVVLPGHVEDVDSATYLDATKSGTVILGAGDPSSSNAPTLRWSTGASVLRFDNDNIVLRNMRLDLTGADGTNGIGVGGENFTLDGCHIISSTGTAQADFLLDTFSQFSGVLRIVNNEIQGSANTITNGIRVDSTNITSCVIANNRMVGGAPTSGWIFIAAAVEGIDIHDNTFVNLTSSSTACIFVSDSASTGVIAGNLMAVQSGGVSENEGVIFSGTTSEIRCLQNFNSSDARASGVLSPPAAT